MLAIESRRYSGGHVYAFCARIPKDHCVRLVATIKSDADTGLDIEVSALDT
jgi:hypothetical protein